MFWNKKDDKTGLPDLPPIKSPFSKELMPVEDEIKEPQVENVVDNQPLPTFPDSPSNKGFSQSAIKEAVSDSKESNPYIANPDEEFHHDEENVVSDDPQMFKTQEVKEDVDFSNETKDASYETSIRSSQNKKVMQVETTSAIPSYDDKAVQDEGYLKPSLNLPIDLPPQEEKQMPVRSTEFPSEPTQIKPLPPKVTTQFVQRPQVEKVDRIVQYEKPQAPTPKNPEIYVKIDKFMSAKKSIMAIKEQVGQIDDLLKKIRETKLREERELSVWEKEIFSIKEKIRDVNDNIFDKTQ